MYSFPKMNYERTLYKSLDKGIKQINVYCYQQIFQEDPELFVRVSSVFKTQISRLQR